MRTPQKAYVRTAPEEPVFRHRSYPFALGALDKFTYNSAVEHYIARVDLGHHIMHTPTPGALGLPVERENFDKTVKAVIDNIYNMEVLCRAREIDFVLVTQKLFVTSNSEYTSMDSLTLECIRRIRMSKRLNQVRIVEMQTLFPDAWNEEYRTRVEKEFPDRNIDYGEPMAYDNCHFTPSGCYLFASLISEWIDERVWNQSDTLDVRL